MNSIIVFAWRLTRIRVGGFDVQQCACLPNAAVNQSINRRNFYSATYKKWTAALDNVNI